MDSGQVRTKTRVLIFQKLLRKGLFANDCEQMFPSTPTPPTTPHTKGPPPLWVGGDMVVAGHSSSNVRTLKLLGRASKRRTRSERAQAKSPEPIGPSAKARTRKVLIEKSGIDVPKRTSERFYIYCQSGNLFELCLLAYVISDGVGVGGGVSGACTGHLDLRWYNL